MWDFHLTKETAHVICTLYYTRGLLKSHNSWQYETIKKNKGKIENEEQQTIIRTACPNDCSIAKIAWEVNQKLS